MEKEKKDKQEENNLIEKTDYRDNTDNALEKIQKTNQEILELTKKINSFIFWQKVFGAIKIFIFLIPLFLAWRLVDGLMNDPSAMLNNPWFSTYVNGLIESIGKNIDPTAIDLNSVNPSNIPAEYRELLQK